MTPDHYVYQCLSLVREQENVYICPEDVNIEVKNEVATFSWADTGKEIMRISGYLRVEDIDAIFAAINQAFRDGFDVGKDDAKSQVIRALGI